ncbi:hypothetical protein E4582_07655 [Luteimonas yindakuii]|uniref:Uncharacterized protein n=1 Tax=Luteimonas yindakuii TaxID=2565782 RepID=A0A4Z1R4Z1_9GAMM|nr:hypothetical protein [Luteimonas yindakuii]QCO68253.1 hypothetical protein E5843_11650 [Luteimonas yindakuii]TKS54642.1 hypothetical protein E4582_07655 [Luteimonas yindakuii]
MTASEPARKSAAFRAFDLAVLAVGCAGFAAIWVLLAGGFARPLHGLAVVAALDAALLLRLVRMRPGVARALAGVALTSVIIVLAQWGVIAGQVGTMFGLLPWESALRLGPSLAWTIAGLALDAVALAWFGAGLVVAAVLSR